MEVEEDEEECICLLARLCENSMFGKASFSIFLYLHIVSYLCMYVDSHVAMCYADSRGLVILFFFYPGIFSSRLSCAAFFWIFNPVFGFWGGFFFCALP